MTDGEEPRGHGGHVQLTVTSVDVIEVGLVDIPIEIVIGQRPAVVPLRSPCQYLRIRVNERVAYWEHTIRKGGVLTEGIRIREECGKEPGLDPSARRTSLDSLIPAWNRPLTPTALVAPERAHESLPGAILVLRGLAGELSDEVSDIGRISSVPTRD